MTEHSRRSRGSWHQRPNSARGLIRLDEASFNTQSVLSSGRSDRLGLGGRGRAIGGGGRIVTNLTEGRAKKLRHDDNSHCLPSGSCILCFYPCNHWYFANMTQLRGLSIIGALALFVLDASFLPTGHSFSTASHFLGNHVVAEHCSLTDNTLTMRKQKASDRRTRRMQRGEDVVTDISSKTMTTSPMATSSWQHKKISPTRPRQQNRGGRGRARKRSNLYNTLSSYHGNFLSLLTTEYRAEVGCFGRHRIVVIGGHLLEDSAPNLLMPQHQ